MNEKLMQHERDDKFMYTREGERAGIAYEAFVRAFTSKVADIEAAPLPSPEAYNGAFLAFYAHSLEHSLESTEPDA